MSDLWCPGAVRSPQSGGVPLDRSLPPRAVWHITWDALSATGQRPAFSAVSGYLKRQAYCPHIMWDPFTGYIEQYYPANVGGRALAAWNQDGAVNLQIEVFFTPGTVYNGKKYNTVAETPCRNLNVLMDWIRSHGVPDRWPLGEPRWAYPAVNSGNSRDRATWDANGGHYGHCHVPDNNHTDPGPMPDLFRTVSAATIGDIMATLDEEDYEKIAYYVWKYDQDGKNKQAWWFLQHPGYDVVREPLKNRDGEEYQVAAYLVNDNANVWNIAGAVIRMEAQQAAMLAAIQALGSGQMEDLGEIAGKAAADAAAAAVEQMQKAAAEDMTDAVLSEAAERLAKKEAI